MLLSESDSVPQRDKRVVAHDCQHEFRVRKGEFIGFVEFSGDRCRFLVRDLRRDSPTIQGSGVDFPSAVTAVTQLLDALADQAAVSDDSVAADVLFREEPDEEDEEDEEDDEHDGEEDEDNEENEDDGGYSE